MAIDPCCGWWEEGGIRNSHTVPSVHGGSLVERLTLQDCELKTLGEQSMVYPSLIQLIPGSTTLLENPIDTLQL